MNLLSVLSSLSSFLVSGQLVYIRTQIAARFALALRAPVRSRALRGCCALCACPSGSRSVASTSWLLRALRWPFALPFPFGINGRRLSIARASSFSAFGLHHWLVASTSWLSQIWKDHIILQYLLDLREILLPSCHSSPSSTMPPGMPKSAWLRLSGMTSMAWRRYSSRTRACGSRLA